MAIDNFPGQAAGLSAPAHRWAVLTPSDSVDLAEVPKFLLIGHDGGAGPAAGNLVARGPDGVSATFRVAPGVELRIRPHRIMATGTTAGLVIIGCY